MNVMLVKSCREGCWVKRFCSLPFSLHLRSMTSSWMKENTPLMNGKVRVTLKNSKQILYVNRKSPGVYCGLFRRHCIYCTCCGTFFNSMSDEIQHFLVFLFQHLPFWVYLDPNVYYYPNGKAYYRKIVRPKCIDELAYMLAKNLLK